MTPKRIALQVLEVTASNIRSLGPAGALADVYEPYRQWLAEVDRAIAALKRGKA